LFATVKSKGEGRLEGKGKAQAFLLQTVQKGDDPMGNPALGVRKQ